MIFFSHKATSGFLLGFAVFLLALPAWAGFSGSLTDLAGVQHVVGGDPKSLARVRAEAAWNQDFSADWRWEVGALASWTRASSPSRPPSTFDGEEGVFGLEGERFRDAGRALLAARLQKGFLRFARAKWEFTVGRAPLSWGDSKFHKPTSVFHPSRPLEPFKDPPVGSDGADVRYSLAANTVLEGAWRRMRNEKNEWVFRLENQGIGVAGTPLVALRDGQNGLGAEFSATLKHFQLRAEGVGWSREEDSARLLEMVCGFGTLIREFPLNLEFVRDGTGEVLGASATHAGEPYSYAVLGLETPNFYRLRFSPVYARAFEGGRHMAKAKLLWEFSRRFETGVEGMWFWGDCPGPLGDFPSSAWGYIKLSL
jgi:hypothetical protein